MAYDPVAARYAQAVFDAAKAEGALDETLKPLSLIGQLMQEHPGLQELMFNPDVDPDEKIGVLERTLKGSWPELVRAFIQMVVGAFRAECLPEIVEAFQALVEEDRGQLRAVVRSALPLSEAVLARLRKQLERQEGKSIELTMEQQPQLRGGIQILLGNRIIDSSVQRHLQDLRDRLMSTRVL